MGLFFTENCWLQCSAETSLQSSTDFQSCLTAILLCFLNWSLHMHINNQQFKYHSLVSRYQPFASSLYLKNERMFRKRVLRWLVSPNTMTLTLINSLRHKTIVHSFCTLLMYSNKLLIYIEVKIFCSYNHGIGWHRIPDIIGLSDWYKHALLLWNELTFM